MLNQFNGRIVPQEPFYSEQSEKYESINNFLNLLRKGDIYNYDTNKLISQFKFINIHIFIDAWKGDDEMIYIGKDYQIYETNILFRKIYI